MTEKNLHKINSTGFKVPDGYFDELDGKILSSLKDVENISDHRTSGFIVPNDYFEKIDTRVSAKIHNKNKGKLVNLLSSKKIAFVAAIAATFILLLLFKPTTDTDVQFADVSLESIESYLFSTDINTEELAQLLSITDIKVDGELSNLNEGNLENYILDHIETEEIIE